MKLFKREKRADDNRTLIQKAWDLQNRIEARKNRIGKGKYGRVLKMARKPTPEEYAKSAQITGIGILLIGGIGFATFYIVQEVVPWIAEQLGLI